MVYTQLQCVPKVLLKNIRPESHLEDLSFCSLIGTLWYLVFTIFHNYSVYIFPCRLYMCITVKSWKISGWKKSILFCKHLHKVSLVLSKVYKIVMTYQKQNQEDMFTHMRMYVPKPMHACLGFLCAYEKLFGSALQSFLRFSWGYNLILDFQCIWTFRACKHG